jgi:hypothetical protein
MKALRLAFYCFNTAWMFLVFLLVLIVLWPMLNWEERKEKSETANY